MNSTVPHLSSSERDTTPTDVSKCDSQSCPGRGTKALKACPVTKRKSPIGILDVPLSPVSTADTTPTDGAQTLSPTYQVEGCLPGPESATKRGAGWGSIFAPSPPTGDTTWTRRPHRHSLGVSPTAYTVPRELCL